MATDKKREDRLAPCIGCESPFVWVWRRPVYSMPELGAPGYCRACTALLRAKFHRQRAAAFAAQAPGLAKARDRNVERFRRREEKKSQ